MQLMALAALAVRSSAEGGYGHGHGHRGPARVVIHKQAYEQPIRSVYHVPVQHYTTTPVVYTEPYYDHYGHKRYAEKVRYEQRVHHTLQPITLHQKIKHDVVTVLLPKKRAYGGHGGHGGGYGYSSYGYGGSGYGGGVYYGPGAGFGH
ncbi:hypothetical protein FJT64_006157 [Amphibalanus amphitrite]|uniref:Uncharacterized protein n=1 Tax=Amphibalanus amphitrite TaxID=1232801 RepID=A0A6A4VZY6_AMPAM|nr:hypothetical protein FJT64_006157 [Amphibalanus amphitrite]